LRSIKTSDTRRYLSEAVPLILTTLQLCSDECNARFMCTTTMSLFQIGNNVAMLKDSSLMKISGKSVADFDLPYQGSIGR
jgi:hypothetical protein